MKFTFLVKQLWSDRGVKDGQHDLQRDAFNAELAKVEQKDRITRIIYDTYVKEIQRVKEKIADDEAKAIAEAQLAEERRLAQLALEKLAEEKKQKQVKHKKNTSLTAKPKVTQPVGMTLHSTIRAKQRAALEPSPTPNSKVRVVGGGGVTNTA